MMNHGGTIVMRIYGKDRSLTTREFVRGQEKINFCPFDEGDIISLQFGATYGRLPITAGVYIAGRDKKGYYLEALDITRRNRAIAISRLFCRADEHRIPKNYHAWVFRPEGWMKWKMADAVRDLGRV